MKPTPTNEADISLKVSESQVRQLYRQTWGGLAGSLLVALCVTVVLWPVIPHWKLLLWLGLMAIVILVRILFSISFQRQNPSGVEVYTWGKIHVCGSIVAALLWGAPAILLWPAHHPLHQMVWPICIVAISASAVVVYSTWPFSYLSFLFLAIIPLSIRLLMGGNLTYITLGFLGLVFSAILAHTGKVMHSASLQTLMVSLRNKALNEQLHREITERQKSQQQLFKANQLTEEASRAKSQFLANMSHELRTPLNGVIGIASLLNNSNLDATQRLYVDTLQASSKSLLTVIENILDFSKIEVGKIDLEEIDFDLHDLLDGIIDVMSPIIIEKKLELICSVSSTTPVQLAGDPGRLRQILLNLLSNAIKFTEKGEVEVTVECQHQSPTEAQLLFSVTDSGIGIPKHLQDQVFESFTQADISTTKKYGGTGLGLAISKALVELLGGKIGIKSQVGEGATFWFTTRFKKQVQPVSMPELHKKLTDFSFLVVDDNTTCNQMIYRRLKEWGADVRQASSKAEALGIIKNMHNDGNELDAIFIDMDLGETDGIELCHAIAATTYYPNVKMILMQPFGNVPTNCYDYHTDFFACIKKPIRYGNLIDTVRTFIPGQSAPDAPASLAVAGDIQYAEKPSERILLAEDNSINQLVIKGIMKHLGYMHIDTVKNGNEAINALQQQLYSLVLMDIQMPQLDGMEATRKIRSGLSGVKNINVPIIALTANAMKGDKEKYLSCGMNGYVTKPVDPDILKTTIEHVLYAQSDTVENGSAPHESLPSQRPVTASSLAIDYNALVEKLFGDTSFAITILREFITTLPFEFDTIQTHIEDRNFEAIKHVSHRMKGAAGNVCAEQLFYLFGEMEQAAAEEQLNEIQLLFQQTLGQLQLLKAFLPSLDHAE